MSRNTLYLVVGLLAAGIAVLGYLYYQESRSGVSMSDVSIQLDDRGLTIEGN